QPSSAAVKAGKIVLRAGYADMFCDFVVKRIQLGGPKRKATEIRIIKAINLSSPGISESAGGVAQEQNKISGTSTGCALGLGKNWAHQRGLCLGTEFRPVDPGERLETCTHRFREQRLTLPEIIEIAVERGSLSES